MNVEKRYVDLTSINSQLTSDHRLSANFDKEVLLNCDVFFIVKKGLY